MLRRVEIENFRSCRETTFDLVQRLSALSGRNGVGKSNTLKALEWVGNSVISHATVPLPPIGGPGWEGADTRIRLRLELDGHLYDYEFAISHEVDPSDGGPGLRESLERGAGEGGPAPVFKRAGETIRVAGRSDPIRVAGMTPAVAALNALLPPGAPASEDVARLAKFFGGMRYYSLADRPGAPDFVSESDYTDWKSRYEIAGELTPSVAMRLIYMSSERPDLFAELLTILGPDGLDVVDRIQISPLERPAFASGAKAPGPARYFLPLVMPSMHMGGSGEFFPFSALSVGTRRVLRILASMLFDERSLMLMEQPEVSIHPGLLRKLIDQLRTYSDRVQMLFTTHSTEVLDIMHPEEILLATAPGGSTAIRSLSSEEIERAKDFLRDDGTLSDFLEPMDAF